MSTEQLARNTDQTPQMEFVAEVKNSTKKVDINVLLDKVRAEKKKEKKENIIFLSLISSVILITGIIGQVIAAIPLVIVAVLIASLLECFYVLPGHINHGMISKDLKLRFYEKFRGWFDESFSQIRDVRFRKLVEISIEWRYVTLAFAFAMFLAAVGLVVGGRIGFNFFPTPESDKIVVNVKMVSGTPREQTISMLEEVERAAYVAGEKLSGNDNNLIKIL